MSKLKKWWESYEQAVWAVILAVGMFAIGAMLTAMRYERALADQQARFSHELSVVATSYAAAMTTKDQLIDEMAKRSNKAAETASKAAKTAANISGSSKRNTHPDLQEWTK